MGRQLFRDFADDPPAHYWMKRLSQVAQDLRRCDDHQLVEAIVVRMSVKRFRDGAGEPLLGDVMPIGFLHRTSRHADALNGSARTICALFARRRILLFQDLLDLEADLLRRALVAQEQSLLAVTDQNEGVVGNQRFRSSCHAILHVVPTHQEPGGCHRDQDAPATDM